MRLSSGAVVIAATCASAVTAAPPVRFEADVVMVRIDVVVLDDDGQPVRGLTASDFEVIEDGRPHELVSFEAIEVRPPADRGASVGATVSTPQPATPEENRSFLLFLDDVHLGPQSALRLRAQLVPFLEREIRDGDWLTVTAPVSGLWWTARTAFERRQLATVLGKLNGTFTREPFRNLVTDREEMTEYQAMRMVEYEGRNSGGFPRGPDSFYRGNPQQIAQEKYQLATLRIRQSLEALEAAIRSLSNFRGRKALLFYSEGFLRSYEMSDYDRLIEVARQAHTAVYFVHPGGLSSGLPMLPTGNPQDEKRPGILVELDTTAAGIAYIAASTGGRTSISNDVSMLLREAAIESSAYYLLGFQPTPGPDGERKIKVRVRRERTKVRATDRYRVGGHGDQPIAPAAEALRAVADVTGLSFRVATLDLDGRPAGERKTTLAVELDPAAGEGDRTRKRLINLIVDVRAAAGGKPVREDLELTVSSPPGRPAVATQDLLLAPGVWQARVVVRDARMDAVGSALHTFEVTAGDTLRMSSPILTDVVEEGARPRPVLKLARSYVAEGALFCQYRVFGAAVDRSTGLPHVLGSWTISDAHGVRRADPPSPIEPAADRTLIRFMGIGLAGLPPGEYTLALRIADEVAGTAVERREPFTIVAGS